MLGWAAVSLAGLSSGVAAAPPVAQEAVSPVTSVSREDIEKLPARRRLDDLLNACPARTIPTVNSPVPGAAPDPSPKCVQPDDLKMIDIYRRHNDVRREFGSPPLVWDPQLAAGARAYAIQLTSAGRLVHSSREGRKDIRENLLQSLPGRSPEQMVGVWIAEQRNFVPGVFPNVSRTGNWYDIGHYTQMIWATTTRVGCASNGDSRFTWLVCRYSPPGNRDGTSVQPVPATGKAPWTDYYTTTDHLPVKADFDGTPRATPSPPVTATPPPPKQAVGTIRCRTGFQPSPIGTYAYQIRATTEGVTYTAPAPGSPTGTGSPPPPGTTPGTTPGSGTPTVRVEAETCPPPESVLDDLEAEERAEAEQRRTGSSTSTATATPAPPPAPPAPAPLPTAADPAPGGLESQQPLYLFAHAAAGRHAAALRNCDMAAAERALAELRHAISEMFKRLKAARAARSYSTVNRDDVMRNIDEAQGLLRRAEEAQRRATCPPVPPPPPPPAP